MLFIFGRCICCCFMIGFCQISIIMEFLRNGFVSVFNLKKKTFSNCVHPLYLDSVCGILYTGAEVANMSWADPCLVKKLWLIHTIFECSVLLAVVFFLVASFVWFFMFFSIFFFLSYRRENMSGLYFSSNQTKLVQKKSKGKLSIKMNLKKKIYWRDN